LINCFIGWINHPTNKKRLYGNKGLCLLVSAIPLKHKLKPKNSKMNKGSDKTKMNLNEAKKLSCGEHLEHKTLKNTSGLIRVKVNGKPKLWKRQPTKIRIPYKYGLYEYGYITESDINEWHKI
jgi:hypothetical protein